MEAVTFSATHTRAFSGSDLTVTVTAGEKESIADVMVQLDGMVLEQLELSDGTESYSRTFSGAGGSAPGMDHTLIVTALDEHGATHSATTRWSDS